MTLTYAELFAGAGGLSRGLEAAGFHCTAHAEIEPNARAVLRYHWPDTRLDGDVTQINGADYAGITLLSGGSPCQDLSVAGKRAGLAGGRSGLFHQQCRIWKESGAPYLLWENVHGAFSSNGGRDFATVLSTLVGATIPVPADGWQSGGVAAGRDAVAAWRVLDLQHFGPPQRRVRVFILAARAGGVDPAEVLALTEGVCGHPSPRQQARERVAGRIGTGAESGGVMALNTSNGVPSLDEEMGTLDRRAGGSAVGAQTRGVVLAFHHTQTPISGDVAPAIGRTTDGMGVVCTTGDITHALTHEGADASEDGTGRGTPIVVPSLTASYSKGIGHNKDELVVVSAGEQTNAGRGVNLSPTMGTTQASRLWAVDVAPMIDTTMFAKHAGNHQSLSMYDAVARNVGRPRRLTPKECERLMSWPDDWTRYGRKEDGTVYELSDTARYRLCGNGVGSVCVEWIGRRLADAIAASASTPTRAAA